MWDIHWFQVAALIAGALFASAVAAVAGFGGAVLLLPVLTWVFGVRDAVPILTIAQFVGNGSRVWFNRTDIDRRVVGWYSAGAVPLALLGGVIFAAAPLSWLTRGVGAFLVGIVVYRRLGGGRYPRCPAHAFAAVGAGASLLSALVGSTGPVTAPFFLAFGLTRGAYIGTEAAATVITHTFKLAAYGWTSLLSSRVLVTGLLLAPCMFAGSWAGKRLLDRMSERFFIAMIETVMAVAGIMLIAAA
ncbi:MAG TPA: sulfite exporter TauE/SafE family protein [Phycisphaerae bacterium]|nr:sulfite exporter TauE/SafE family protein [Phycisphaerae bacterium]HRR86038.1 sulfite exporter TauE/SafE family protein [Phycisphaerae bacterium]